jgi:glutathione peroxidase
MLLRLEFSSPRNRSRRDERCGLSPPPRSGSVAAALKPLSDLSVAVRLIYQDWMTLPNIELESIDGHRQQLAQYAGKVLLVVNVASKCGFTPQYTGLEALQRRFSPQGFSVLGFPCNQFGGQEPGSAAEIGDFCKTTYDVTFPMFAKVDVNGPNAHELFRYLKAAAPGVLGLKRIKWNFTKFLVSAQGEVVRRYGPTTKPEAIDKDVQSLLPPG